MSITILPKPPENHENHENHENLMEGDWTQLAMAGLENAQVNASKWGQSKI